MRFDFAVLRKLNGELDVLYDISSQEVVVKKKYLSELSLGYLT